jgi:hypothetical protein
VNLACLCGAPATHQWRLCWNCDGCDASSDLVIDCCSACGDRYQAEMEALNNLRCDLLRAGIHERMVNRIISVRTARKELLPSVPFPGEELER